MLRAAMLRALATTISVRPPITTAGGRSGRIRPRTSCAATRPNRKSDNRELNGLGIGLQRRHQPRHRRIRMLSASGPMPAITISKASKGAGVSRLRLSARSSLAGASTASALYSLAFGAED